MLCKHCDFGLSQMKDDQCGRTVAISLIVSLKPPHYGRSSKVERDKKSVAKLGWPCQSVFTATTSNRNTRDTHTQTKNQTHVIRAQVESMKSKVKVNLKQSWPQGNLSVAVSTQEAIGCDQAIRAYRKSMTFSDLKQLLAKKRIKPTWSKWIIR